LVLQGLFSSFSVSKEKHVPAMETEDSRESIRELPVIFSKENFPCDTDDNDNLTIDEDEVELNIGMKVPYKCDVENEYYIAFNMTQKIVACPNEFLVFHILCSHLFVVHILHFISNG
jgi:hypothetical protein